MYIEDDLFEEIYATISNIGDYAVKSSDINISNYILSDVSYLLDQMDDARN